MFRVIRREPVEGGELALIKLDKPMIVRFHKTSILAETEYLVYLSTSTRYEDNHGEFINDETVVLASQEDGSNHQLNKEELEGIMYFSRYRLSLEEALFNLGLNGGVSLDEVQV